MSSRSQVQPLQEQPLPDITVTPTVDSGRVEGTWGGGHARERASLGHPSPCSGGAFAPEEGKLNPRGQEGGGGAAASRPQSHLAAQMDEADPLPGGKGEPEQDERMRRHTRGQPVGA